MKDTTTTINGRTITAKFDDLDEVYEICADGDLVGVVYNDTVLTFTIDGVYATDGAYCSLLEHLTADGFKLEHMTLSQAVAEIVAIRLHLNG